MTIKRLLVLSALPLVIGGFGFNFLGKAVADQSALVAQNSPQPNGQRKAWGNKFAQLNLTDAQKAQIQKIHESKRQQMDAILTSAQKEQLRVARAQGQRANLNLTEDQKAKMKAVHTAAKSEMEAVLTAEQKQKLQELKQQWRQNRQNGQPKQS